MLRINPKKYVRKSIADALATATGLKVWDKKVPKDFEPKPTQYILISSQVLNQTEESKEDFEWLMQTVVDIVNVEEAGYASTVDNDDVEQLVNTAILDGIQVLYFDVKETKLIDSLDLNIETPTNSIYRRVITFQHWLQQNIITT